MTISSISLSISRSSSISARLLPIVPDCLLLFQDGGADVLSPNTQPWQIHWQMLVWHVKLTEISGSGLKGTCAAF